MATQIDIVDPLNGTGWDDLLAGFPGRTIFHESAWAQVLAASYGQRFHHLRIHEGGRTLALVPMMDVRSRLTGRRGVCMPFADHCEPLLAEGFGRPELMALLERHARERGWKYLEVRGGGEADAAYDNFELDLRPGLSAVGAAVAPAARRCVRRAEREGLTAEVRSDEQAVGEFYRLHGITRQRHGLPPQPMRFFMEIKRRIMDCGKGELILARAGGRIVAASMFLFSAREALYKFGASDPRFLSLRPNHLVMWHAIRRMVERGCETLGFGRTRKDQPGLARFKQAWGGVARDLCYDRFVVATGTWVAGAERSSGTSLFGILPAGVNRVLGRLIYPHLD